MSISVHQTQQQSIKPYKDAAAQWPRKFFDQALNSSNKQMK